MKRAFTLIEVIITMVILSIVAYIATDLVLSTYKGYNQTNSIAKANLKLEIALNSISNRLEYAISNTIVKRKSESDDSLEVIDKAPNDYSVLEWIGYDNDSFIAQDSNNRPGWSGFCDIKNSTQTTILTPGSALDLANTIITKLSNKKADLKKDNVAIFFPGNYEYKNIGYKGSAPTGIRTIKNYNSALSSFTLNSPINRITELYKLAWSAYAVVPICGNGKKSKNGCDLVLRYNFRPWKGDDYRSAKALANSKLLATEVSVFKTYATANRIHIKICIKEEYMPNQFASICKEKVVFK